MFLSMTGFGRASQVFPWGTVTLEISSVNHRYQEIGIRLPKELLSLENKIVSTLRSALKRGKIRLTAEVVWSEEYRTIRLDTGALASYYNQLKTVAEQLGGKSDFDLTSFLSLPGVCDVPRSGEGCEELWDNLIESSINAITEMKRFEGNKLYEAINGELLFFKKQVKELSERWNQVYPSALDSLKVRIDKLIERYDLEIDQGRIAQEVSMMSDKWDVTEELTRLDAHISKFNEISSGKESEGRKLDFLIQEMNRELNTMGSKVNDAEFRWKIVEAKSSLERIREQIQNVE